jgi:hypothetical protein
MAERARRLGLGGALAAALVACRASDKPRDAGLPAAPSLETFAAGLLATSGPELEQKLAALVLDPTSFDQVITTPYDRLYAAYAAHFPAASADFAAELRRLSTFSTGSDDGAGGARPPLTARRHYADDPALSLEQARLRWALPVQAESWVLSFGAHTLDAVWVTRGGRWFLLLGLDEAARAALAAAAPSCADHAPKAGRAGGCSDAVWMAQDAALRAEPERLARACDRAAHFCP